MIINTEHMIVNCRERNVCRVRQLLILLSGLLITKPLKYELIKGGKEQHVIQYILIAHPEVPLIKESLSLTIPNPRAGNKLSMTLQMKEQTFHVGKLLILVPETSVTVQ